MTPTATPPSTTTSALMRCVLISRATSSMPVSSVHEITPSCMHSRTESSGMGEHLQLDHLGVAAPHRFHVLPHHGLPPLAQELAQRAFDRGEDLALAEAAPPDERRGLQEDAEKHDPLHALHEVRLAPPLPGGPRRGGGGHPGAARRD